MATVEEAQKPPKPRAAATLLSRVGKRLVRLSAGVFLLGAGGSALSYYALVKTANFPKTLDGFYVDFNLDELSISETGGDSDNYGPLSSFFLESQKRLSLKQTLDALHKVMKLQKTLYSSFHPHRVLILETAPLSLPLSQIKSYLNDDGDGVRRPRNLIGLPHL